MKMETAKKNNFLVIGYYNRQNLGDDVFKYVFEKYFEDRWPDATYNIINIDDFTGPSKNTTAVIFGGGDLINDYFMRKIRKFITNKTCPYYAIGVGIPYPKLIDEGYLDSFDYIVHRNKTDELKLLDKYDNRVKWYPDISTLLLKYCNSNIITQNNKYKNIGIFLSRHSYDNREAYDNLVASLTKFIGELSEITHIRKIGCRTYTIPLYKIYLIPFCTDGKINHDDRLINHDIYSRLVNRVSCDNIKLIREAIAIEEIIPLFQSFHITICSRFHAHMFSVLTKTPILSIYSTRKVDNLLDEIDEHAYAYKLSSDRYYINSDILMEKFLDIEYHYAEYVSKIEKVYNRYVDQSTKFLNTLDNLLFSKPRFLLDDDISRLALSKSKEITKFTVEYLYSNMDFEDKVLLMEKLSDGTGTYLKYCLRGKNKEKKLKDIVEIISFTLTGLGKSQYNYGLREQIVTDNYNLRESCEWILNHKFKTTENFTPYSNLLLENKYSRKLRKINMNYINNTLLTGYHRSGWPHVLEGLNILHNPRGTIFDSYLDRTFGWEYDLLSRTRVIPYEDEWVGVFHHTADEDYTENNLENVFKKENFRKSLNKCKGLIVLSSKNKKWLVQKLKTLDVQYIPVLMLYHPTESVEKVFDYNLYKLNPAKKIIQIGAWLRNSYSIFNLNISKVKNHTKFALKGKGMDNYFISDERFNNIKHNIINSSNNDNNDDNNHEIISGFHVNNRKLNKYIVGLINTFEENHNSVSVLSNITNEQYDDLLSMNIVFINLVDASAVNTIIECIIRNTPIIVNRLSATIEYLGSKYPLFYDNVNEVNDLLSNKRNILKAHRYLRKMDKTKLSIDNFIKCLVESDMYNNLL